MGGGRRCKTVYDVQENFNVGVGQVSDDRRCARVYDIKGNFDAGIVQGAWDCWMGDVKVIPYGIVGDLKVILETAW